jgi:hypothetical protein
MTSSREEKRKEKGVKLGAEIAKLGFGQYSKFKPSSLH